MEAELIRLRRELAACKTLLDAARPYLRGIRSTNLQPRMDGSAYPGWLDEPRTAAKRKPAEWWDALTALRSEIDAQLITPQTPE